MPPAAYTVRGVIESVAGDEVSVHHEAVPGFEGRDGSKSDMMSMTMSFGIGDGVDRALLKPGAKVAMTFEVHWDARPALRATKFKALPASTELKLE